jgi:hypothetical protein
MATRRLDILIGARDRASKTLTSLRASVGRLAGGFALAGGVAGGVAAVGIATLVRQQMRQIDASAKASDRINANIEGLTGLGHAAAIYGADLDTVIRGGEKLQKNLGDLAAGPMAEVQRGLDTLGLTLEDLEGKKYDEQFLAIAGAMETLESQQARVSAAQALFGRRGIALVNVLQAGRGEIERLQGEAGRLGLTFDRLDAARVEAANDAMHRMRQVLVGVGRVLAIEVSPLITAASEALLEAIHHGGGLRETLVGAFEDATVAAGGFLAYLRSYRIPKLKLDLELAEADMNSRRARVRGLAALMSEAAQAGVGGRTGDLRMLSQDEMRLLRPLGGRFDTGFMSTPVALRGSDARAIEGLMNETKRGLPALIDAVDRLRTELARSDPDRVVGQIREFFDRIRAGTADAAARRAEGPGIAEAFTPGPAPRNAALESSTLVGFNQGESPLQRAVEMAARRAEAQRREMIVGLDGVRNTLNTVGLTNWWLMPSSAVGSVP